MEGLYSGAAPWNCCDVIHLMMTTDVVANGAGSDGTVTVLQSPFICVVSPTNRLSMRNGIVHSFVRECECVCVCVWSVMQGVPLQIFTNK